MGLSHITVHNGLFFSSFFAITVCTLINYVADLTARVFHSQDTRTCTTYVMSSSHNYMSTSYDHSLIHYHKYNYTKSQNNELSVGFSSLTYIVLVRNLRVLVWVPFCKPHFFFKIIGRISITCEGQTSFPGFQIRKGSQVKNLRKMASWPDKITSNLKKIWRGPHLLTPQKILHWLTDFKSCLFN